MTVEELIKRLQEYPAHLPVYVQTRVGGSWYLADEATLDEIPPDDENPPSRAVVIYVSEPDE